MQGIHHLSTMKEQIRQLVLNHRPQTSEEPGKSIHLTPVPKLID